MMRRYAETHDCRRVFLLSYFGEDMPGPCGDCDNCRTGRAGGEEPETPGPFQVHARVEHAAWGGGEVIRRDPDRLTVLFDTAGYRELALETVLEQDILRETPG
ncbi:RecQ family zinc-binding domain-containing protein [Thermocatellispora tengchongensis]